MLIMMYGGDAMNKAFKFRIYPDAVQREKIEKTPAQPVYVCTKWGMGYFFRG